jgi:hypothetical protein
MTILKETTGDTVACDGCGRTDAGPNQTLHIDPYTVQDPNIGGGVRHHYCAGCAANRGLADPIATIAGWEASPAPTSDVAPAGQTEAQPPAQ